MWKVFSKFCCAIKLLKMSWLFGSSKDNKGQIPPILGIANPPPGPGGDDKNKTEGQGDKTRMEYSFDSKALERAAQAAKDLEKSRKIVLIPS